MIDFAARYGLVLDPWQQNVLRIAMGERPDGKWAAAEVGVVVPRQNGKGSILEARELAGLFLLNEPRITHTAHEFKTAGDGYKRIRKIVENSPELMRRVKRMPNSPIEKGIELKNGNTLSFIARSGGSGRGFSGDVIILDEAYDLTQDHMDALGPTLTTAANPQVWYTSSAGKSHSQALTSIRRRGIQGVPRLAYMEWSVDEPDDGALLDVDDESLIALANPGFGIRFGRDYLELERGMLSYQGRLRERLGIFDRVDADEGLFDEGVWDRLANPKSKVDGPVMFGVEVAEDRTWGCVAAAGAGSSATHGEYVDYRPNTAWIVARCAELAQKHPSTGFVVRPSGPAGSLIAALQEKDLRVVTASGQEYAQACGLIFDAVVDGKFAHLGQPALDVAVSGAQKKRSADAFTWDLRNPALDISPWVAVTLAVWGHEVHGNVDVSESVW